MMQQEAPKKSNKEDSLNFVCVHQVISEGGKKVLYHVYIWGCLKPRDMPVKDYLLSRGNSSSLYKRCFNLMQRKFIETDPTGKTYDLSLLYRCIQTCCSGVAAIEDDIWITPSESLENLLYRIKNERNHAAHAATTKINTKDMISKIEAYRLLLIKTLQEAGRRFNIEQQEITIVEMEVNRMIKEIQSHNLAASSPKEYLEKIREQRSQLQTVLINEGKGELKEMYSHHSQIGPQNFLWPNYNLNVTSVFTQLELLQQEKEGILGELRIENLFEIMKNGEQPQVILIEGVAGSGKSTIVSYVIADWLSDKNVILGLEQFDLVFHVECRLSHISSFMNYLLYMLPKTSSRLADGDLIRLVLMSKVLFVIDGLDEMNSSSHKLIKEICQKHLKKNVRVLCTTRPERFDVTSTFFIGETSKLHLKVAGIPSDKQLEFIIRYYDNLMSSRLSMENVNGIIRLLHSKSPHLSEHFRLPLNLVFLVYLNVFAPELESWHYSATKLYLEIQNLTVNKLQARLLHKFSHLAYGEVSVKCEKFLDVMYQQSILALHENSILLNDESIESLHRWCKMLNLPPKEILSGFLTHTTTWTGKGYEEKYSFPHKGIQDFYAACHIISTLTRKEDKKNIDKVKSDIEKVLMKNDIALSMSFEIVNVIESLLNGNVAKPTTVQSVMKDLHIDNLTKFQNVLIHLVGLLANKGNDLLQDHAKDIVTLLKDSGIKDSEQWLDIILEAEYNAGIVKNVAEVISPYRWLVREGHMKSALLLLSHCDVRQVDINIERDPYKVNNLEEILQQLTLSACELHLNLKYQWQHPEESSSDEIIKNLQSQTNPRFRLSQFMGSLKDLTYLTAHKKLANVYIAFGTLYGQSIRNAGDKLESLKHLKYLYIHIVAGLPAEKLPVFPDTKLPIDLWLSSVDDSHEEWVKEIKNKFCLLPSQIWSIRFPRSKLTKRGCITLNGALRGLNIGNDGVWVSSPNITEEDARELSPLFLRLLNAPFKRVDDVKIWSFH